MSYLHTHTDTKDFQTECSQAKMDYVVIVRNALDDFSLASDIVLPVSSYDADLGMRTRSAIKKQLQLDVPRAQVTVDGIPRPTWTDVYRVAPHPRLCTQAVLAPIVEWFHRNGLMLHETRTPLRLKIHGGHITVHKRLRVCEASTLASLGEVSVTVHAGHSDVVVSVSHSTHHGSV